MSLNDFYRKIEDAYYKAMDFLNDKTKIPVYDFFVNPIETRGIPSLPVAILVLLLLLFGIFAIFFGIPGLAGEGGESKLSVFVQSAGAPLDGAKIVIVADGSEVVNAISKNGRASFTGLPATDLIVRATLDGYNEAKAKISWPAVNSVRLELKCASAECAAQGGGEATATPPSTEWTLEGEAKLVVTLSDAATSKLADGQIRVYNAKTNTLLKSQKTIAGQAIFEIDAGTSVYANAEADGYLAYDGSAKQLRLKQGRNDLSLKLTPTRQSGCKDGLTATCMTTDGYAGTKACAGGAYGACVATPLGCTHGPSVSCTTFDNCAGNSTCNATRFYGACVKIVASCSSHCTPGATIPCTTPDGYNGTMTCNSSGFYGACTRVPRSCTAGTSIACTTSDSCAGTMSCNATGFYGACVKTQTLSQCQGVANYATSVFRVVYSNGSGIAAAKIDVYNASNTAAPLVRDKLTNANGSLSVNLSNAAGAAYFAVASKTGFFEEASGNFSAGDAVSITLIEVTPAALSRLNASAFDDERSPVNEAAFALFATNARGQTYRVAEKTAASGKNFVVFDGLRRGANVTINASKGAADGSAQALLASENNSANVTLVAPFALLRFQAIDLGTGDPIASAVFQVTRLGASAGSCSGVNCTIRIYSGRFYNATAAAQGFEPNPFVFPRLKALPEQELNLTASFLSSDSVEQTAATLVGVYEKESGLQATHLISGQEYTARFQLAAKPNAELDGTGIHVSFGESGLAYFTGYGPRAAVELASQSSEDNGCSGIEGTDNGLSFANKKYEWLDLEYDGARSIAVDVDFKISSNAHLDPRTHQGTLTLRYRSFGRQGSGSATQIFRNPFDEALGIAVDSPLESGCNAQANEFALPLSATTCDDTACLWLSYSQGNAEGGDGFKAQSMKRVNPASSDYKPLAVHYAIDFLAPPAQTQGLALVFSAPPANIEFTNYSDPLNDSNDCGSMAAFKPAASGTGSWTLDLSRVAQCSNYGRFPMRLEGVAYAAPQDTANQVNVQLVLSAGQTALLTKQSWLNITNGTTTQPTGDAATLSLKLNQTQNGRSVHEQSDSNDVFSAGSVTVDSQLRLSPPQQNYSYVYAEYAATARYDVYNARIEISVPSYASSPLRFLGVLPDTGGFIAANSQGLVEISGGDLRRGRALSGKALFAPVLASGAESAYGQIVLRFKANDWAGAALTPVERAPKQVFVSSAIAPPSGERLTWFAPGEDNCGGLVNVTYSAEGGLSLGGCTRLGMRISSLLPADAVPFDFTLRGKQIALKAFGEDQNCLTGVEQLTSTKILKYDASACSLKRFKPLGNDVGEQNLTLKLWVVGVGNADSPCPAEGQAGDVACVKVTVKKIDSQPSLVLSHLLSNYSFSLGAQNAPVLMALTNNRQYPANRDLTFSAGGFEQSVTLETAKSYVFAVKLGTQIAVKEDGETVLTATAGQQSQASASLNDYANPSHALAFAYWRSNNVNLICQVKKAGAAGAGYSGECTEENVRGNSPALIAACCKSSIDDWRHMIQEEYVVNRTPCRQCVSYPAPQYNCDDACGDVGGGIGIGNVENGTLFFNGSSVLTCGVAGGCNYACTAWCGAPICDSDTNCVGNVKTVTATRTIQDPSAPWLNADGTELKTFYLEPLWNPSTEPGSKDKPFGAIAPGSGLKFSVPTNTINLNSEEWTAGYYDVSGCKTGIHAYEGLYDLTATQFGEIGDPREPGQTIVFHRTANAIKLPTSAYYGYSTTEKCSKTGKWEAGIDLCEYLWVDYSTQFGTCVSSVAAFDGGVRPLGDYKFALVYSLGSTGGYSECTSCIEPPSFESCTNCSADAYGYWSCDACQWKSECTPAPTMMFDYCTKSESKWLCGVVESMDSCAAALAGLPSPTPQYILHECSCSCIQNRHSHSLEGWQKLPGDWKPVFAIGPQGFVIAQAGCGNGKCRYDVWDALGTFLPRTAQSGAQPNAGECGSKGEADGSSTGRIDAGSEAYCALQNPTDFVIGLEQDEGDSWFTGWEQHDISCIVD